MASKRVVIDWDWGASGIWSVRAPDEPWMPPEAGGWVAHVRESDHDRHQAWRGVLSDDLIDALQAWNDRGAEVWGVRGHEHTDEERAEFWDQGSLLAAQTQQQLGSDYEVVCRIPNSFAFGTPGDTGKST